MKKILLSIISLVMFSGCSIKESYWPDKERWKSALVNASTNPNTLVPAIGSTVLMTGKLDYKISEWARNKTPIFGSEENAQKSSDIFRAYAGHGAILSSVFTYDNNKSLLPVFERIVLANVSGSITAESTDILKEKTSRERPNAENKRSFPSGHTSAAFSNVGVANRNIESLNIENHWKYTAQFVETSFGAATAWARVEAGSHYPSDVLAGAALGNFIAILLHDAFLTSNTNINIQKDSHDSLVLVFQKSF